MTNEEEPTEAELYLESMGPFTLDNHITSHCKPDPVFDAWIRRHFDNAPEGTSVLDLFDGMMNETRSEDLESYHFAIGLHDVILPTLTYSPKSLRWWLCDCLFWARLRMEQVARFVSTQFLPEKKKIETVYNYDDVKPQYVFQIGRLCRRVATLLLRDESIRPEFWEILDIHKSWKEMMSEFEDMDPDITHYYELLKRPKKVKEGLGHNGRKSAEKSSKRVRGGIDSKKLVALREQNKTWTDIKAIVETETGKKVSERTLRRMVKEFHESR